MINKIFEIWLPVSLIENTCMGFIDQPELKHRIALSMMPGIGGISARKIISLLGSPSAVFTEKDSILEKVPRVGKILADRKERSRVLKEAEDELEYIRLKGIQVYCHGDPGYPARLAECHDAPLLIYCTGKGTPDASKVLGIVGTRRPTPRGLETCMRLIAELEARGHTCLVVSGLAYGIDHCAHLSALDNRLETIAVLGHGLRFLYPARHRKTADRIMEQGALLTDFASRQKPEPNNFIRRNRIIAGLSDALVVVESGIKGGALVTAELAGSYHRDVFAFPGRTGDPASAGCNSLIKSHKAALIESCGDLEYILGWESGAGTARSLPQAFSTDKTEDMILEMFHQKEEISTDELSIQSGIPLNKISGLLLELEFKGLVQSLPGNRYRKTGYPDAHQRI
jgi:DNA processing protein